MLKRTLVSVAALALTASLAFAQSSTTSTTTNKSTTGTTIGTPGGSATTSTQASTTTSGNYLTTVDSKAWLGSKLIGSPVYTSASDERIGEINNIIIDSSGQVTGFIIGAGGFLGVGERDIAVRFQALKATTDDDNNLKLTLDTTKDALKEAPEVKLPTNTSY